VAIAGNDNWGDDPAVAAAATQAGAFPLNAGSKDAAAVVTLNPGLYTVVVTGVGSATGAVLIEIYELP
jgi:hypothetical protein